MNELHTLQFLNALTNPLNAINSLLRFDNKQYP